LLFVGGGASASLLAFAEVMAPLSGLGVVPIPSRFAFGAGEASSVARTIGRTDGWEVEKAPLSGLGVVPVPSRFAFIWCGRG
jgi:hypothetical protein